MTFVKSMDGTPTQTLSPAVRKGAFCCKLRNTCAQRGEVLWSLFFGHIFPAKFGKQDGILKSVAVEIVLP